MDTLTKLGILAEAARFDAACTSSGVQREARRGSLGMASNAGCCHSFTADGRCITLLKVLMTNVCTFDCAYCINRRSNHCPRATFEPCELAELTIDFYRRNYIEGLFLSSGILGNTDNTTERMIECLRVLRDDYRFNGYIHAKVLPGTSSELIDTLGRLADRLSMNIELPSATSLQTLCPEKNAHAILKPMAQIAETIKSDPRLLPASNKRSSRRASSHNVTQRESPMHQAQTSKSTLVRSSSKLSRVPQGSYPALRQFAPAGHATQMIIGATPENDRHILKLTQALYKRYRLKRVFFSAYVPLTDDPLLPDASTPVPLRREHRLYQADWLLRYYPLGVDDLLRPDEPWLDLDVDPKLAWALRNIRRFPVEINEASYEDLLRVPGIGVVGAQKILSARRASVLTFDDLKRLRITLKRARHFITCSGKRDPQSPLDPQLIRERVIADAQSSAYNRTRRMHERQLTLF